MQTFPSAISTIEELDEILSRPSEGLIEFMKKQTGDLMILGAGGKVGPTLARMAQRARAAAGGKGRTIAVDLFPLPALQALGIETLTCDMLDPDAVARLPRAENVVYMIGHKFGSTGNESTTWAVNVLIPHNIARTLTRARIAVFSTGCVYPVMDVRTGGATEETPPDPVGEYAMSCLGRERVFEYFSAKTGEKVVNIRLNYSVELRYGVLFDVATRVWNGQPVDVTTGFANVIWQGDACSQILQSLALASSPATPLNVTGPEIFAIREVAHTFGRLLGKSAIIEGQENGLGYLNNARQANALFGNPSVPLGRVIEWIAHWIRIGGPNLGKPTHFEAQNGKY
jgi:nucleoside-diphosphate-sugar epimerase